MGVWTFGRKKRPKSEELNGLHNLFLIFAGKCGIIR
nr:MAG TPA: hypothetical protein [Caudoviricetes sp.]